MASLSLGKKHLLLSNFKSIPKTSVIEANRASLQKTYEDFMAYESSEELKDFLELDQYIQSPEHHNILADVEKQKKEDKAKQDHFLSQKKSSEFKKYFKFKNAPKLKEFESFEKSEKLDRYFELQKKISSDEFKKTLKAVTDKKCELVGLEDELKELNKNSAIKKYFKLINSTKYKRFLEISKAGKLEQWKALDQLVHTPEFRKKIAENTRKEIKFPEEQKQEDEYQQLKKDRDLKFYFKYEKSAALTHISSTEKGKDLHRLNELTALLKSEKYNSDRKKLEADFEKLDKLNKEFAELEKDKKIKWFFKFKNANPYQEYIKFGNSKQLSDYLELEAYLASEERKKLIQELEKKEKAENEKVNTRNEYIKSEKYKWYLGLKNENDFDQLLEWNLVFEDDFSSQKLNRDAWSTRYFQGEQLLNDAYVLDGEKAFLTDGDNLSFQQGSLKIEVKRNKVEGKVWKPPFGFTPQAFEYTSGIINSSKACMRKYGKIEAKIKIDFRKGVDFNFWLGTARMLPHIDILRVDSSKNKIKSGYHYAETSSDAFQSKQDQFSGLKPSADYFIYTLEWSPEKLVWKVNDIVVNTQNSNIPKEEMYVVFSANIRGKIKDSSLPASMLIDWVRWYEKAG